MRRHFVTVWCILLVGISVAMVTASGCSDTNDDKNLLTNPNGNNNPAVKTVVPPLSVGEVGMDLALFQDQVPGDTVVVPPKPDSAEFHEKIPNYTRKFIGDHDGTKTCYKERGNPNNIWCHIPSGSWASYYTTSPRLDCPPDSVKLHIYSGPYATREIYGWHIYSGPYYSYYYVPGPDESKAVYCRVPDTIVVNAGKYMPMGGTHLASGVNASCYERHGLGFDPNLLPEGLREK